MADQYNELPDSLVIFLLILILLSIPLSVILVSTTCIASFRTRRWKAEKRRRAALPQSDIAAPPQDNQHSSDSDSDDSEMIDPDDPVERKLRDQERRDKAYDWHLSTGEKFWKEWKKAFTPFPDFDAKQRVERAKKRQLVKGIAKEMVRMQRREDRKAARDERRAARRGQSSAGGDGTHDVELPAYQKVRSKGEK